MEFFRKTLALTAALISCMLASCIDGREEYWLASDGSGRIDLQFSLPSAVANLQGGEERIRTLLGDFLTKSPALVDPAFEVKTEGDRLHVQVRAAFKSAADLQGIGQQTSGGGLPPSARGFAGEFKITAENRILDFSRTLSLHTAIPGVSFIPPRQFENREMTYIVHLPVKVRESNATEVSEDKKTLTWKIPLATAVKGPFDLKFRAPIPIPTWLIASIATAFGLVLAVIIFVIRRVRLR